MRNPELVRLLDEEIPRLRAKRAEVRGGIANPEWKRVNTALTDALHLAAYLMEETE